MRVIFEQFCHFSFVRGCSNLLIFKVSIFLFLWYCGFKLLWFAFERIFVGFVKSLQDCWEAMWHVMKQIFYCHVKNIVLVKISYILLSSVDWGGFVPFSNVVYFIVYYIWHHDFDYCLKSGCWFVDLINSKGSISPKQNYY